MPKRAENPFSIGYCPELDVSPVLGPDETSYYQSLIRVMMLMVQLKNIDINTEVFLQLSHLAMPRKGHWKLHFML